MWLATGPLQQLACGLGLIAALSLLESPWVLEHLQPFAPAAEERDFADLGPRSSLAALLPPDALPAMVPSFCRDQPRSGMWF